MQRPGLRAVVALVAVAVTVALLLAPSTRWLVLDQLRLQFERSPYVEELLAELGVHELPDGSVTQPAKHRNNAVRMAAARHSRDPGAQIVLASLGPSSSVSGQGSAAAARLREVARRMPDEPAVWAAILRYDTVSDVRVGRTTEQEYASSSKPQPRLFPAPAPSSPARLHAFVDAAEAGERSDPRNALFPFMRAGALFAVERDNEALAAIRKAARLPLWEDYANAEMEARIGLEREALGRHGAVAEMCTMGAALRPEFAFMRSIARVAAYKAIRAEQAGLRDERLAIREDLLACADLMRGQARATLGALVASALAQEASRWPGGKPLAAETLSRTPEQRAEAFAAYVRTLGGDADRARRQLSAARETRAILQGSENRSVMSGLAAAGLLVRWALGLTLLAIVVWCAVAGAAAWALGRAGAPWGVAAWVAIALLTAAWPARALAANVMLFAGYVSVIHNLLADSGGDGGAVLSLFRYALPAFVFAVGLIVALAASGRAACKRRAFLAVLPRAAMWTGSAALALYAVLALDSAGHESRLSAQLALIRDNECAYSARLVGKAWPGPQK